MKGSNDDNLEFPFTGIFTALVLNWNGNSHHIERSIEFDDDAPLGCREQVTTGEGADGWGISRFLPHDDLTSYLHHNLMCFKIGFYPIEQTIGYSPVPSWCNAIYSTLATPPCTRTLYSYSVYKKTSGEWWSQPFYSSDNGYKLQLKVHANGDGSGKGTHLSLYVVLMKGEYDNTLSWPFNATITLQLLNWPSDNHHREGTIDHHNAALVHRQRVVKGTRAHGGIGYAHFISHISLESPRPSDHAISFINDDNICFSIINVDIIN